MTNMASECKSAKIVRDHAMILPDDANPKPDGIFGKDRPLAASHGGNAALSDAVVSLLQGPAGRRIIGAANETASAAVMIAQETNSPIPSSSVLGIAAAEANRLTNVASEPKGVFAAVVKGPMVRPTWPDMAAL
jgi:hypothetical protein